MKAENDFGISSVLPKDPNHPIWEGTKKVMKAHIYNSELDILKKSLLFWMDEWEKLNMENDRLREGWDE